MADCDAVADDEEYRRARAHPQARRPRRGRLQRHLAPGAQRDQRHAARRQDERRRRLQVDLRPARLVHLGHDQRRSTSCIPEGTRRQRAAARRRGLRLLGAEPGRCSSAMLRALAKAVGEAAIAGDRGSADIHNANGILARRHALDLGRAGRRRGRALRREPPRRRRQPDALLPGQRHRRRGRGGRVGRAGRRAAPRDRCPTAPAPGCFRGGASMLRDSLWLTAAQHHLMSLHYKHPPGLRRERRRRRGDRRHLAVGRGRAAAGAAGSRARLLRRRDARRRRARPAARTSPRAAAPTTTPTACRSGRPSRGRCCATSTARGGGCGDPLERDVELVKRDVRDGYVTIAGAARDYGVVVARRPGGRSRGARARPRGDGAAARVDEERLLSAATSEQELVARARARCARR